ncbi:MAG: TlpA family protein disulfide reductase [Sulfuricella sp.]|nr:TlpA family protein disulfide reductase [Sulfuricella sp.]
MKQWLAGLMALCFSVAATAADYPDAGKIFSATFDGLDGKPVALADFKGKPLILNFWATWCAPCRKEIPDLIEVQKQFSGRGLTLIGLAVEEPDKVADFVKEQGINYPVAIGRDKGIWLLQTLGNKAAGLPYTVLIDRAGNIVFTKRGAITRERLEELVAPLL